MSTYLDWKLSNGAAIINSQNSQFKVEVYKGDITSQNVDAIVNPANQSLQHDGGCAQAICRAAGAKLADESANYIRAHGPIPVSSCTFTSSGNLSSNGIKYVVHTVGPIYNLNESLLPQQLQLYNAVFNACKMADNLQC